MKHYKFHTAVVVIGLVLMNWFMPALVMAQGESFLVMTLADGTNISLTSSQLAALKSQPGITTAATAEGITSTQMAVPLPAGLGGGFVVAEPAALAQGLNAVGAGTNLTATSFAGATAAGGGMVAGAAAGGAIAGGLTGGTIALGVLGAAVIAAGIAAALGSGGGGGSDNAVAATAHH